MSYLDKVFKKGPKKEERTDKILFPENTPIMLEVKKVREIVSNDKQYFSLDCAILDGEYKGQQTDIFFPTISGYGLSTSFRIVLEAFVMDEVMQAIEKADDGKTSDEELNNVVLNIFTANIGKINGCLVKAKYSEVTEYTDKKGKKKQGQYLTALKVMAKPEKDMEF